MVPSNFEKLNVALIGAGNFARHQHLPNLLRIPQCILKTVCDLNAEVLEWVQNKAGVSTTQSFDEVLKDEEIDAVVISVRDDLQANFSCQALKAGKHVYVEKPLAKNSEDAHNVLNAVEKSGKKLAVGFNRRYAPMYQQIKKVVDVHGAMNIHLRMADDAWRWAKNYDPGFLIGLDAGHLFDLIRWLTGSEMSSCACMSSRPDDDSILIQMKNGCVVSIMLSSHGSMDMPKERCEIMSQRGGLIGEDFVELRTYGYEEFPYRMNFEGHSHPENAFMHKGMLKHLGAEGFAALRRNTWEQRQKVVMNRLENSFDGIEVESYVNKTIPNFLRDQGWLASMAAFIDSILSNSPSNHADAADALAATQMYMAVKKSQQSKKIYQC